MYYEDCRWYVDGVGDFPTFYQAVLAALIVGSVNLADKDILLRCEDHVRWHGIRLDAIAAIA